MDPTILQRGDNGVKLVALMAYLLDQSIQLNIRSKPLQKWCGQPSYGVCGPTYKTRDVKRCCRVSPGAEGAIRRIAPVFS
jgi:hypothetical protein